MIIKNADPKRDATIMLDKKHVARIKYATLIDINPEANGRCFFLG